MNLDKKYKQLGKLISWFAENGYQLSFDFERFEEFSFNSLVITACNGNSTYKNRIYVDRLPIIADKKLADRIIEILESLKEKIENNYLDGLNYFSF